MSGRLFVVGLGPGDRSAMTGQALAALSNRYGDHATAGVMPAATHEGHPEGPPSSAFRRTERVGFAGGRK